jgi:hypothetical protein
MSFILARLKEPSTWAGAATLLAGVSFIPHSAELAELVPSLGVVVGGLVAIFLKEKVQ